MDIRQDSEFATGYGYTKTDVGTGYGSGYPKRFYRYFEDSDFWKKLHIAQLFIQYIFRSIFSAFCAITPSLSIWYNLCTIV